MYQNIDIRLIEAFHAVMKVGTTTAAAEILHTSQPSVSRSLHRFESLSNIRLFTRKKGRLIPTPEAQILFQEIERTYSGLDNIVQTIQSLKLKQTGHVSVVCSPVLSFGFISDAIQHFNQEHPNISVRAESQLTPAIADLMAAQKFDIALANHFDEPPGVKSSFFANPKEVCVFPSGHRFEEKKVIALKDLEGEPQVGYPISSPIRRRMDRLFTKHGIVPDVRIETPMAESVGTMVSRGLGVALLNPFTAVNLVEKLGVIARPFEGASPYAIDLWLPEHRPTSALAESLLASLSHCKDQYIQKMNENFHA